MQVDIDNGYDAFAIDNSRNTESDQPGVDSQHSTGVSMRVHYLRPIRSASRPSPRTPSPSSNTATTATGAIPCSGRPLATVYQYSEIQNRDRTTKTLELRLGTESTQGFGWLVGVYGNQLDES
jgi:iron complex outermembrane receptor protein